MKQQSASASAYLFLLLVAKVCAGDETNETLQIKPKFATPCVTPNNDMAVCIQIDQCPLFNHVDIAAGHELYEFLKASSCGPATAKIMKVCCGQYSNYKAKIEEATTERHPLSSDPSPLPLDCGLHGVKEAGIVSRIYGGKEAYLGEFPWLVRIMRRDVYGNAHFGCTGFLIHKRFVLTAAHCVESKELAFVGPIHHVVLGEHNTGTDRDCFTSPPNPYCSDKPLIALTGTEEVHKAYNNRSSHHTNDIALIPLKKSVVFTDYIQPICISEQLHQNSEYIVSGWGKTEKDDFSEIKLKVAVPFVPFKSCSDKYKTIGVELHGRKQLCAGGIEGQDSCSGDSGGPLMTEVNGKWYAEGIVSFGVSCGKPGWAGIYTNLAAYAEWIKKTIARKVSNKARKVQLRQSKT